MPNTSNDSSKQNPDSSTGRGSRISDAFKDLGASLGRLTNTALQEGKQGTSKIVSMALHKVGANPEEQKGVVRTLVQILPFIGPSVTYADAWKLWQLGKENNSETIRTQARAHCILAISELGVDVALLGPKLLCGVAKASRHIMPLVKIKAARSLKSAENELIRTQIEKIADTQPAKGIAEYLLNTFNPTLPKPSPQVVASTEKELDKIIDQAAKETGS